MARFLSIEQKEKVAIIKLRRSERGNALNGELIKELSEALSGLAGRAEVVVLTATGKTFCAGADLSWLRTLQMADKSLREEQCKALSQLLYQWHSFPGITISLVFGQIYGAGVGLAAASDIAIGTPDTSFILSEVGLGIAPACILPYLTARCGKGVLTYPVLSMQAISASQARTIGLLQEVADFSGSEDIYAIVRRVLRGKPQATLEAASLLKSFYPVEKPVADAMALQLAALLESAEAHEAVWGFLERSHGGAI